MVFALSPWITTTYMYNVYMLIVPLSGDAVTYSVTLPLVKDCTRNCTIFALVTDKINEGVHGELKLLKITSAAIFVT